MLQGIGHNQKRLSNCLLILLWLKVHQTLSKWGTPVNPLLQADHPQFDYSNKELTFTTTISTNKHSQLKPRTKGPTTKVKGPGASPITS